MRSWLAAPGALALAVAVQCNWLVDSEDLAGGADNALPDAGPTLDAAGAVDGAALGVDAGVDALSADAAALNDADHCPPAFDAGDCDGGVTWRGRCYWSPATTLRIGEADALCAASGGYAATFTCADEWAATSILVNNDTTWTAGRMVPPSTDWSWSTGEPFTFAAWGPGQPLVGDAGFPCIAIDKFTVAWSNYVNCTASRQPFCERGPLAK